MKQRPCVRGLREFKKGCPQKPWDPATGEGCPLWKSYLVKKIDDPTRTPEIKSQCVDEWQFDWLAWANAGLAGNQAAIESFRNGMTEQRSDGQVGPKQSPEMLSVLRILYAASQKHQAIGEQPVTGVVPNQLTHEGEEK